MTQTDLNAYISYDVRLEHLSEVIEIFDLIMKITDLDFSPLRADRRTALPEELADADLLVRMKTVRVLMTRMKKIGVAVGSLYDPTITSDAA